MVRSLSLTSRLIVERGAVDPKLRMIQELFLCRLTDAMLHWLLLPRYSVVFMN